jgi:hypothetical protein
VGESLEEFWVFLQFAAEKSFALRSKRAAKGCAEKGVFGKIVSELH